MAVSVVPFDDRPSIREQGHFVGIAPKLQDKIGVPDGPMGLEPSTYLSQI